MIEQSYRRNLDFYYILEPHTIQSRFLLDIIYGKQIPMWWFSRYSYKFFDTPLTKVAI